MLRSVSKFSQGENLAFNCFEFRPVPMITHWIILPVGGTRLYSFHDWKSKPTTPMVTASFDRASGSLLRKEAKPDHDCKE
jgi:hypothetical protein